MVSTKKIEAKVCRRCHGAGELPCFAHVLSGICFRCWGLGTDPRTIQELEAWLVRARKEYVIRRDAIRSGHSTPALESQLAMIVMLGKQNRRRADKLRAAMVLAQASAKAGQ